MSDDVKEYLDPGKKNLILIYILYLCGLIIPVLPIVGAVFAFANQGQQNKFLQSHYIFVFRTFYIGLAAAFIAMIATFIFIGPILYILIFVWLVVRSIIAIKYLLEENPHPNPLTFWIK
jgi:uncharacterized membrane protein